MKEVYYPRLAVGNAHFWGGGKGIDGEIQWVWFMYQRRGLTFEIPLHLHAPHSLSPLTGRQRDVVSEEGRKGTGGVEAAEQGFLKGSDQWKSSGPSLQVARPPSKLSLHRGEAHIQNTKFDWREHSFWAQTSIIWGSWHEHPQNILVNRPWT